MAAALSIPDRFIKAIGSVRANELLKGLFVGVIGGYGAFVFVQRAAPGRIGFGKEPSCIQGEHLYWQLAGEYDMCEGLVFLAETGGKANLPRKQRCEFLELVGDFR